MNEQTNEWMDYFFFVALRSITHYTHVFELSCAITNSSSLLFLAQCIPQKYSTCICIKYVFAANGTVKFYVEFFFSYVHNIENAPMFFLLHMLAALRTNNQNIRNIEKSSVYHCVNGILDLHTHFMF